MFDPILAWEEYTHLEEEFLEYLRYVPLAKEHYNVWSLHLGDHLLKTCSLIDSFFKRAIFCPQLNEIAEIEKYRELENKNSNIGTHREIFNPLYKLSKQKMYDLRTFESLVPFSKWDLNQSPDWWNAYNDIKHDRFANKKEATLKVTLEALSALFILNVLHLETMPILVDYEVLKSRYTKESTKEIIRESMFYEELPYIHEVVFGKTNLFGYVFIFNDDYETYYEEKCKQVLSPSFYL
jgi:hypothetical protein